jgi:hypothetical protein
MMPASPRQLPSALTMFANSNGSHSATTQAQTRATTVSAGYSTSKPQRRPPHTRDLDVRLAHRGLAATPRFVRLTFAT